MPSKSGPPSRDLNAARDAFDSQNREQSVLAHSMAGSVPACETGHDSGEEVWYDMMYSALDGAVVAIVVLSALHNCNLGLAVHDSVAVALSCVLGLAVAFSVRDHVRCKTEVDHYNREYKREKWELENFPAGEIKEMVELYVQKGVGAEDAQKVVETMAKYEDFFVDVMMAEELGLPKPARENPAIHALGTLLCAVLGGFVPVAVFVLTNTYGPYEFKELLDIICTPSILAAVLFLLVSTFATRPFLPTRMSVPLTVLIVTSIYFVVYVGSQLSTELSPRVQALLALLPSPSSIIPPSPQ